MMDALPFTHIGKTPTSEELLAFVESWRLENEGMVFGPPEWLVTLAKRTATPHVTAAVLLDLKINAKTEDDVTRILGWAYMLGMTFGFLFGREGADRGWDVSMVPKREQDSWWEEKGGTG